ncbi:alpha/beta hydrolase [Trinickia terrae]|uniref:Alpha/beta hydrolase n=1 Tax=Trinickia terrae TaxID=2571161 RepID=A0A4U1HZ36_9BURK|nr:alpha/beta hydrolase [Trinickia terrae]TKC85997.1 alpha/beta hydrolase [Trinickia terrae]
MSFISAQDIWIDTAEGRLFAKRWNPAPEHSHGDAPIMLFHDSLGCVELWRDFPEQLALSTGRSVIAYDRLGFGQSDPHRGKLEFDFVRNEARSGFRALLDALRLESFVAFGHSVGGGMAVCCAAAHAAHCNALVTEAAQAFVEDRTIAGILDAKQAFQQPGHLDRLTKYHGDKAAWVLSAWIDTWLAPEFAGWNLDDDLRHVQCPVLAIHGDQDEYGSTRHPERIAGMTAGHSAIEILPNCGHVPHREESDAVIQSVKRWLDGLAID